MCLGISDDLREISDSRKTIINNSEFKRLNIDVATLQETRLLSDELIHESDYTSYWHGRHEGQLHIHGVGFAAKNSLITCIEPPIGALKVCFLSV